jgi:hypothetical protein
MAPWALEAEEEMSKLPIGALALALLMCFTVTAPAVRAALADGTPATATTGNRFRNGRDLEQEDPGTGVDRLAAQPPER